MDLKSAMDSVKSGLPNPTASLTGSLTSKINELLASTNQSVVAYANSLKATMDSASKAAGDVVASLGTKLPLMKAAENISAKMTSADGAAPPTTPSSNFTNAFAPATAAKDQLTSLQSGLTPEVMTRLKAGTTTDLATLNTQNSSASSAISSSVSSATSAISDSISNLKAFSLAKFASMPHPPHVQKVLDDNTPLAINKEMAKADSVMAAKKVSMSPVGKPEALVSAAPPIPSVEGTRTPTAMVDAASSIQKGYDNLAAIGYGGGAAGYKSFKNAYFTYMNTFADQANALSKQAEASRAQILTWRETNIPNYDALKAAATNNPNDSAAVAVYEAAKNRYLTEGGVNAYRDLQAQYELKSSEVKRLQKQFDSWVMDSFIGVTAGPTW